MGKLFCLRSEALLDQLEGNLGEAKNKLIQCLETAERNHERSWDFQQLVAADLQILTKSGASD